MLAKSSSGIFFALSRFEYSYSLYEIAFMHKKKLLPSIPTPAQLLSTAPGHKKQQESARNENSFGEEREKKIRIDLDREPLKYNGNGKEEHCWRFQVCMFRLEVFSDNYFIRLNNNNKPVSFESFWQAICKSCLILY